MQAFISDFNYYNFYPGVSSTWVDIYLREYYVKHDNSMWIPSFLNNYKSDIFPVS